MKEGKKGRNRGKKTSIKTETGLNMKNKIETVKKKTREQKNGDGKRKERRQKTQNAKKKKIVEGEWRVSTNKLMYKEQ